MAIVKGGVWTNVEDEILKAAVSKYGKNQWARISSLLVRKAPKQCKARWYEWLDPGIKKVEWTREEDEKLLHLAKLLPTQWRTIAPIVGRTSTQCLERYQKLLDDAEAAENSELGLAGPGAEGAAPTADSVRKLRAGETDPDPETKPAKPDAIDMDEDEKEMLSEARARLANTQGKKAKRKQREKLLAETKRLSVIQKRRDLKAAGINTKLYFRKKGDMDYNADIPFEHKPALGFYDTTEEAQSNEKERRAVDFRQVEQKRRDEASAADERKKNFKKREVESSARPGSQAESLEKLRKAEQLTKRRKLNLPGPQVSDRELEEIVKLGHTSSEAQSLALTEGDNPASQGLLGDYSTVATNQPIRTPRTPAGQDVVNLEARNLRASTNTQSSLFGAENTPLHSTEHGTGYAGATPRAKPSATPNPMQRLDDTPRHELHDPRTPMRTPHRDNLLLNSAENRESDGNQVLLLSQEETSSVQFRAAELRAQFASLPAPKNDFELQLPEDIDEGIDLSNDGVEDAAERDARLKELRELEESIALQKRSLVVQRDLPRPKQLSGLDSAGSNAVRNGPEKLIAEELARLVVSDAVRYPVPGGRPGAPNATVTDIDLNELTAIRKEVAAEADLQGVNVGDVINESDYSAIISLGKEAYGGDDEASEMNALSRILPGLNAKLQTDASRISKFEKKMGLVLGGYQNRSALLSGKLQEATSALQQAYIDLATFEALQADEEVAITTRREALQEEVRSLDRIRTNGQERFRSLSARKEDLLVRMLE